MSQANVINFTTQIEGMIAFADAAQDFVLAAWLTEALIRMKAHDNSVETQI
jgi:HAMP domain-containing protein